tara:strand:- start:1914 stop:3113 length:1200 start_codon:yes stop_codon:yes gene_type:complete
MNLFFFIFSKFKNIKINKGFLSFNFYLSIFLISISLTALILTESFTSGYKKSILSKIGAFSSDVRIVSNQDIHFNDAQYQFYNNLSKTDNNIDWSFFKESIGIIFSKNKSSSFDSLKYSQREGVYVLGLNQYAFDHLIDIKKYFLKDDNQISNDNIIIGNFLAKKLNKTFGDSITLIIPNSQNDVKFHNFIISNIYHTGTKMDNFLIYISMDRIKYLSDSTITGIMANFDSNNYNDIFNFINDDSIAIKYKNDDNLAIINFLNKFDRPIKLLMWILMFLSLYSLSTVMYNFIIEKKKDLKILYCLGLNSNYLKKITVSISFYITLISILIGIFLSTIIIYIQNKFHIINLPSEQIFQVSILPADFSFIYLIKYPLILLITAFLMTFYIYKRKIEINFND